MKVLSLDLDLFFPCHKYAQYMFHNLDADKAWGVIDYLGIDYEPNKKIFNYVMNILDKKCKKAKFDMIEEHDEILDSLIFFGFENVDMYNLDFHHDLGYGDDDYENTLENWVKYGKSEELINEYHWLHHPASDLRYTSPFFHTRDMILDVPIDSLPEFDLVVICLSKHFTPKKYWYLQEEIINKFGGIN